MFPNPQDALPLPSRPNLERYKKLAKELARAAKSAKEDAIQTWAERWVTTLVRQSKLTITPRLPVHVQRWIDQVEEFAAKSLLHPGEKVGAKLTGAQFVIARSHGFESWPKFAKHLERLEDANSAVSQFEAAADAIVNGNRAKLKRLLRESPELIKARSTREHEATLLHYVSANGVEGYRQRTPKNIVEIAEILLHAGAEVDAQADVYGGGSTTLGLTATSVHPQEAGVQEPLMQLLLDHGASMELPSSAGHGQPLIRSSLANGQPKAAGFLASRGAPVDFVAAAALGQMDRLIGYFNAGGSRKPNLTQKIVQEAFRYACAYRSNNVVEFLLAKGVDLAEHSGDGQTAAHYAVIGGHLDTLKLLLRSNPPLEAKNMYGGTVLGQALWSAAHGGDPEVYIAILEALIAAGAEVPERHVPVNPRVDSWLEEYGSHAEPKWYWCGEKPRRTSDP